jgi:hypothetical protein
MEYHNINGTLEASDRKKVSSAMRKVVDGKLINKDELYFITGQLDECGINIEELGERNCYLVPIDRLGIWFNDQNLADRLGLDDHAYENINDTDRLKFARSLLSDLGDALDADIHPSLIVIGLTDGENKIVLGYAISGYSFSGIELAVIGFAVDEAALCKKLSNKYLLIDDRFFVLSFVDAAVNEISDSFILKNWDRNNNLH